MILIIYLLLVNNNDQVVVEEKEASSTNTHDTNKYASWKFSCNKLIIVAKYLFHIYKYF